MLVFLYLFLSTIVVIALFQTLKWAIGHGKLGRIINLIIISMISLCSLFMGYFMSRRYSVQLSPFEKTYTSSIQQIRRIDHNNYTAYGITELEKINNEEVIKIISQLNLKCSTEDSIVYYPCLAEARFLRLDYWVHKRNDSLNIFYASEAERKRNTTPNNK